MLDLKINEFSIHDISTSHFLVKKLLDTKHTMVRKTLKIAFVIFG